MKLLMMLLVVLEGRTEALFCPQMTEYHTSVINDKFTQLGKNFEVHCPML